MQVVVNPGYKVRDKSRGRDCVPGEVFDVPEKEGRVLKALGRVSEPGKTAASLVASPPAAEPPAVETPVSVPDGPVMSFSEARNRHRELVAEDAPVDQADQVAQDDPPIPDDPRVQDEAPAQEDPAATGRAGDRPRRYGRRDMRAEN